MRKIIDVKAVLQEEGDPGEGARYGRGMESEGDIMRSGRGRLVSRMGRSTSPGRGGGFEAVGEEEALESDAGGPDIFEATMYSAWRSKSLRCDCSTRDWRRA